MFRTSKTFLQSCYGTLSFRGNRRLLSSKFERISQNTVCEMEPQVSLPPNLNFYRRPLPEKCISFSSDLGKTLFKEALISGHLVCYFKLASQFRTQDEPAFCGLSTLVMVLNALEIDPGQIWKGPWRWYHENMLDCCTPLEIVQQNGINFNQFICVASCNNLNVSSTRVDEAADENTFRNIVKYYTQQDKAFMVLSYSRAILEQTGDGHFSPVGGYHPERDMILIMDTARFKYPPHWVSLPLIFKAMKGIDQETGKPRGYIILGKQKRGIHLLLFQISQILSVTSSDRLPNNVTRCLDTWKSSLKETVQKSCGKQSESELLKKVLHSLSESSKHLDVGHNILSINTLTNDDEHRSSIKKLVAELESVPLYKDVSAFGEDDTTLSSLFDCSNKSEIVELGVSHFLSFFLLSWPYSCVVCDSVEPTLADEMTKYVNNILASNLDFLKDEVLIIRSQLENILNFNDEKNSVCCNKSCSKKNKTLVF